MHPKKCYPENFYFDGFLGPIRFDFPNGGTGTGSGTLPLLKLYRNARLYTYIYTCTKCLYKFLKVENKLAPFCQNLLSFTKE